MEKSNTFCIMPHIGMAIQNFADMCCCNVNTESWKNSQREVMHVYSHPVENAFNSHTRKIIAAHLDRGIQHESCRACWDLEAAGATSTRQLYNERFGDTVALPNQPRVLIIKPGNTCQLACRMCNPATSSSWYKDGYQLEKTEISFNEYTRSFETIRNSFNRDNEEFWHTLKTWIENFEYIDVYGGEPFLMPTMFDLLEHGVKIGASKRIRLNMHTNAMIYNQRYVEILSQYKYLNFHVSIDSANKAQLEYIRHNAVFDTVIENSLKFKKFFADFPQVEFGVTYTVTPINIYYNDQAKEEIAQLIGVEQIDANIVTTPEYDIRHLPVPVKQLLIDRSRDSIIVNFLKQTIPGCNVEWPKFCRYTDQLDQLRNQSFAQTFPEWWSILESYWVRG